MSTFIVGLTGGIGCGKSTIAAIFADFGVEVVDADIVAREVVAPQTPALASIAAHFGKQFITSEGELDRACLRDQIFSHPEDKQWLNALLHPLIRESLLTQLTSARSTYCLLVAPLLIENNLTTVVDRVLVIDVDEATQITRTTKRDHNTKAQVQRIIASQISRAGRLQAADDIIDNRDTDLEKIRAQVATLHQKYCRLAAQQRN